MDMDAAIIESKQAIYYFFNNDFDRARKVLEPWANSSMFHSLGFSVFAFLEAMLTFEHVSCYHHFSVFHRNQIKLKIGSITVFFFHIFALKVRNKKTLCRRSWYSRRNFNAQQPIDVNERLYS